MAASSKICKHVCESGLRLTRLAFRATLNSHQETRLQHLSWGLRQEVSQNVLPGCQILVVHNQTLSILCTDQDNMKGRLFRTQSHLTTHEPKSTFAHVADLLLEDVVAVLVHVGPQEVLKAVVDLEARRRHGHPLPHGVALRVGKQSGTRRGSTL